MAKVVKTRKTRSDIAPERLLVRRTIAFQQQAGRTRLAVEEVAREAFSKLVGEFPERMGKLALDGMKDVVRGELSRSDTSGNPTWISTSIGVGGSMAREYVHASVATGEALRDAVGYREEMMGSLRGRIEFLRSLLDYAQVNTCTVQEAILALNPEAEEQEIAEIVEQLEAIAA